MHCAVILAKSDKIICKKERVKKFSNIVIMYFSLVSIQLPDAIYHQICCRLKVIQYKINLIGTFQ